MKLFGLITLALLINAAYSNYEPKCLNGHTPSPSDSFLHGQCSGWNDMSCCSAATSQKFHSIGAWKGFNMNHCGQMSDSCKNFFLKGLCMYECDPYLGQWIVQDETGHTHRTERYYQIPLCRSDCNNWFNACKGDFTCRDNWNKGFKWVNKTNYCPEYEKCETFKDKFHTAENFCSSVWDSEYKVADEPHCLRFDLNKSNPNKDTSERIYELKYGYQRYLHNTGVNLKPIILVKILLAILIVIIL